MEHGHTESKTPVTERAPVMVCYAKMAHRRRVSRQDHPDTGRIVCEASVEQPPADEGSRIRAPDEPTVAGQVAAG